MIKNNDYSIVVTINVRKGIQSDNTAYTIILYTTIVTTQFW